MKREGCKAVNRMYGSRSPQGERGLKQALPREVCHGGRVAPRKGSVG